MKMLFRNFTHTFGRFITVNLMNLLGLAIAFAAFYLIMTQVDYEYNYNKGHKEYEKIYRVIRSANDGEHWGTTLPRPLAEMLDSCSVHLTESGITYGWTEEKEVFVGEKRFKEQTRSGFGDFMKVFQPTMIDGSTDALNNPHTVILSESTALRLFGTTDAVGKTFFINKQEKDCEHSVGGVFKDFPLNSDFGNEIYVPFEDKVNKGVWNNWNYSYFLRIDNPDNVAELTKQIEKKINEALENKKGEEEEVKLVSIVDNHFSKDVSTDSSSRASMYLLICASLLIVLIAGINFTNFSLAETPMRIKSINTQKMLGGSTLALRTSLIIESMLISVMAFGVTLILLHITQASPLKELVDANVTMAEHLDLLGITLGVSLLIGMLAGLYPSYYVTSFPPALALKGSFGLSPRGQLLRTSLVCFQFMVTFILICCVSVMYLQSYFIHSSDFGYDKEILLVGSVDESIAKQGEAVINELTNISGVEGATFSQFVLSAQDNYMNWGMVKDGNDISFNVFPVDAHFLKVMGIKLVEGRDFKANDETVFIFNEVAKKQYPWLKVDDFLNEKTWPVIAFCENVKCCSYRVNNDNIATAFVYYGSKGDGWQNQIYVRVGTGIDKIAMCKTLQKTMNKFSPGYDCNFQFIDQVLNKTYKREQLFTQQILLFSLLTILISIIGVLGLTMFESEYRRKEIGIRKVMGSSTREILLMFNKRYLKILIGCFIVSAPTAWYLSNNWLQQFVERTPISLWIFALAFVLVAAITICVVTYQSWKNANENPIESIKTE